MNEQQSADTLAAQWIRRKEFGDWDDAAEREFRDWIEASFAHRVAYLRLEEGWRRTERLAALRLPGFGRAAHVRPDRRRTLLFSSIAAAVIAVVLGAGGNAYFAPPSDDVYSTPVGGREVLTLFDGSHVELNTDTILKLGKGRRTATLVKGEAFFQIRHDAAHPFVVIARGHRITDLGTKFTVRDSAGRLEVALLEGSAQIAKADAPDARATTLTPGDIAVATAHTLKVTRKPLQTLANGVGWRHGVVIFRGMALADAAAEFNRYNLKQLVVGPKAANVAIDGTFATDNLETFARIVHVALGLRVESRQHEIVITR
jgi:transmembrane sensor